MFYIMLICSATKPDYSVIEYKMASEKRLLVMGGDNIIDMGVEMLINKEQKKSMDLFMYWLVLPVLFYGQ